MNRGDLASFRRQSQGFGRDLEKPRGSAEIEPRLDPVISGFEHWDAVMRAQRCDALPRPTVAVASNKAIPIEDAGDEIVIGDQHQLADSRNHIG